MVVEVFRDIFTGIIVSNRVKLHGRNEIKYFMTKFI
jgi:hypothetical protein